jgi:hypothetical protein
VQATYFSAEAAVNLLAHAGSRRIRTLGVDGGVEYSGEFTDLQGRTLLANGQTAFDLQFQGIARTILRSGIDFAPLNLPSPIIVYVADCLSAGTLPLKVLEYSIRKRTSMSVQLFTESSGLCLATPEPNEQRTAPHRAIVLRPDVLVLDDLRKLWVRPFEREGIELPEAGASATGAAPAIAVVTATEPEAFVRRCRHALRLVGASTASPAGVDPIAQTLPARWHRIDRSDRPGTAVLYYAALERQPWISRAHPFAHLWISELLEAVSSGFIASDLVRSEADYGHVRPSLVEQVDRGLEESLFVGREARRRDADYAPLAGPTPAMVDLLSVPSQVLRAVGRQAHRRARAWVWRQRPGSSA